MILVITPEHISSDGTVATGKFLQFKSDEDVVEAGVWYHVATTFDISTETCTMYLNGSAIDNSITLGSSVGATIYNSAAPFAIGQDFTNGSSGNDYDGIIDDAAIFSRVLTGSEVATLFNLEPAISDSIAVTESATLDVPVNSAISDSVTLTDSPKMTLISDLVPTESVTVSEYVDVTIRDGLQISIWQENITVTDKPEFPGPRDKSFEENITVTESVTVKITDESNDAKPNIKVEY